MIGELRTKRDELGQVFTPSVIAEFMVKQLLGNRESSSMHILDPCVGPGTFISSAIKMNLIYKKDSIFAVDIDQKMIDETSKSCLIPNLSTYVGDYLLSNILNNHFDYIFLNPPYIRQEWIKNKVEYGKIFKDRYNLEIPGTSNLYVYFIVKAIQDLKSGGCFSCLVYDSWQSTKYGQWLKETMEKYCENISIQTFHDQPFENRLIDVTVIQAKKRELNSQFNNLEDISFTLKSKSQFHHLPGFEKISDLFTTKRGLRLKQADFFLCDPKLKGSTKFVKKVNLIKGFEVSKNHREAALIVTKNNFKYSEILKRELNDRLKKIKKTPEDNVTILRWNKERPEDWFIHSKAPIAYILFNYYLRNRPKHLYNPNIAFSDNFYGLTGLHGISPFAWLSILNSTSVCIELLANSRNQGGGLSKLQLYEYRECAIPDIRILTKKDVRKFEGLGLELTRSLNPEKIVYRIDNLISEVLDVNDLKPELLGEKYREFSVTAKQPKK